IYERYPLGLGFTEKAYELLHGVMPAVLESIRRCPCEDGCPCCVGKPLRQYATWNVERGEASIPSKASARMILKGLLADGSSLENPDAGASGEATEGAQLRVEMALRRRLERMREPQLFHPIEPRPERGYPDAEEAAGLSTPDVAARVERRRAFQRELRKRVARHLPTEGLEPHAPKPGPPAGMKTRGSNKPPTHFSGRPRVREEGVAEEHGETPPEREPIRPGDSLAARARRLKRERPKDADKA
ncbi:MAG: Zn-binding domain-containing protein, partial [Planctomycetota bacterium]